MVEDPTISLARGYVDGVGFSLRSLGSNHTLAIKADIITVRGPERHIKPEPMLIVEIFGADGVDIFTLYNLNVSPPRVTSGTSKSHESEIKEREMLPEEIIFLRSKLESSVPIPVRHSRFREIEHPED